MRNSEEVYRTIPSRMLAYWTQRKLDEHIDILRRANALDKARTKDLQQVYRDHFLDYKRDIDSDFEMEITREPLPRGGLVNFGRAVSYLATVGTYALVDPYLRGEKPTRLRLFIDESLTTHVTIVPQE